MTTDPTRGTPPLDPELMQAIRASAAVPGAHWGRILFCAKESVYKAWFPLTRRWLNFEDACVDIDPVSGTFSARLLVEGPWSTAPRSPDSMADGWSATG